MIKLNLKKYIIQSDSTILDAAMAIKNNKSRCILVNDKHKVLGVLSEGDILSALIDGNNSFTKISDVYNKNIKYLLKDDIHKAFNVLQKFGISLLPVLSKNFRVKGIYTINYILEKIKINDYINTNKSRLKKIKK
jgi:predicted transcriptional regulator